jgi:DNA-binding Xre family transcriptional regulator
MRGDITVRFDLLSLKHELEKTKGREVSWAEIGRGSEVHPNTLSALLNNKARRVDLETLERLLVYFNDQGLDVTPGDLFVMEKVPA